LKTLHIDIGTHVGWNITKHGKIITSGTFHLATDEELETQRHQGKERTLDIRFVRMLAFLEEKMVFGVERIVFEDVTFCGSPMQTQLWSALRAAIWVAGLRGQIAIFCVPVTTLKVFATGKTRADKAQMAEALINAEPELYSPGVGGVLIRQDGRVADDNEVDAIWLARFSAAVDRGEEEFLAAFQRKVQKNEARKANRVAARARKKARKARKLAEAKEKKHLLQIAVRTAGKCCGVMRRLAKRNRAICPKCQNTVKLDISPGGPQETSTTTVVSAPPLAVPAES
jgi:hypothetical protein